MAALAANVVGFTVPTVLAQLAPNPRWAMRVYSGAVGGLGIVTPELASVIKRRLGGADEQWRLSFGDSANVGPYKAILGDLGLALGNLVLYGAAHAGLSAVPGVASTAGGRIGRALAVRGVHERASVRAASPRRPGTRCRVTRCGRRGSFRRPPTTARSRDGVYLRDVPAWHERTNLANKAAEMAAHAIGVILGAVVMDVIMENAPDEDMHPSARSAWDIMLGVGALFAVSALVRAVFIYFFNDPAKHANRFGIAASDVMTSTIEASAMNRFEEMLDKAGADIASGHWGPRWR